MSNLIDFKDWNDFPRCAISNNGDNVFTSFVEYKQKFISIDDKLIWYSHDNSESIQFTVTSIRLNPTIRVSDGKTYYLLINCIKKIE